MKIMFSRFEKAKSDKLLDVHKYGVKSFPIKIKKQDKNDKPKRVNRGKSKRSNK